MRVCVFQVDAFTARPFRGNPAAVAFMEEWLPEDWLQGFAEDMNLSETAFLVKENERFRLRWFTPRVEVELCGHATLAAAHVLWESGRVSPSDEVVFTTLSGELLARPKEEWIELDFPAETAHKVSPPSELSGALGVRPLWVGRSRFDYLVEVNSEETLRKLKPDFSIMKKIKSRGVIVTSPSTDTQFDFVSRFFAPNAGIDEDPVTGSAHCTLGPFWKEKTGRREFTAYQVSIRGGVVRVKVDGPRVILGGQAVTITEGIIHPVVISQ